MKSDLSGLRKRNTWNWKRATVKALHRLQLLSLLESVCARRKNVLRVLAYHRVDEVGRWRQTLNADLLSATPETFARQMRHLAEHYYPLSCRELVVSLAEGKEIPPGSVLVTFDDGYRDFATTAWPILKEYGIPATLFVATAYPGDEQRLFWWDRLHQGLVRTTRQELNVPGLGILPLNGRLQLESASLQLKGYLQGMEHHRAMTTLDGILEELEVVPQREGVLLSWEEIKELAEDGVVVGAHTRSHPFLARLSTEEIRQEVAGSQEDLRRELGQAQPIFCYPDGQPGTFDERATAILREEGILLAFTTIGGLNVMDRTDPLLLRRIGPDLDTSLDVFRFLLAGIYAGH